MHIFKSLKEHSFLVGKSIVSKSISTISFTDLLKLPKNSILSWAQTHSDFQSRLGCKIGISLGLQRYFYFCSFQR